MNCRIQVTKWLPVPEFASWLGLEKKRLEGQNCGAEIKTQLVIGEGSYGAIFRTPAPGESTGVCPKCKVSLEFTPNQFDRKPQPNCPNCQNELNIYSLKQ